jgi:hypothetical protein
MGRRSAEGRLQLLQLLDNLLLLCDFIVERRNDRRIDGRRRWLQSVEFRLRSGERLTRFRQGNGDGVGRRSAEGRLQLLQLLDNLLLLCDLVEQRLASGFILRLRIGGGRRWRCHFDRRRRWNRRRGCFDRRRGWNRCGRCFDQRWRRRRWLGRQGRRNRPRWFRRCSGRRIGDCH